MYYVQLITGLIIRSKIPFSFEENGWSMNIDVSIRLLNADGHPDVHFHSVEYFSFRRESAVAYWGV
jgi:hypothetical protein